MKHLKTLKRLPYQQTNYKQQARQRIDNSEKKVQIVMKTKSLAE